MKKKIVYILILMVVGIAAFYLLNPAGEKKADAIDPQKEKEEIRNLPRVEVSELVRIPVLRKEYKESSTLEALQEVVLYPRVTGRLEKFMAEDGQSVGKDQVIAELDHRETDAQISSIKAQIAVSEAQLASAKATYRNALAEKNRYKKLVEEGYATNQQLDDKETAYLQAEASVNLYTATIRQYKAELEKERVNLSEFFVKSPIDGKVLEDYSHTPGEMITTSIPIMQIGDTNRLKAVIQAPESRAVYFSEGMKALLKVDSAEGREFEGSVTLVAPSVDASTRTTKIEVKVDNSNGLLKPGMFAQVFIVERESKNALVMPREAVLAEGDGDYVLVIDGGKVKRRDFKAGIRTDKYIEVLDGLVAGDKVVVSGGTLLDDGEEVSVVE